MADQPQPDFSQNQQYAPGFQPQVPIPGISSSYNQQPQFQQNQFVSQQADQIAVQSMVSSRTTMALAQQNLMQSMHTALLGTIGAFSDMSRRSGAMITSMSPAGRYNDMLAPNQNWALESSFRREAGFGLSNWMGLDPYNSPMSRLIQGRRPEFLTEGEYSSTMGYAGSLRKEQFLTGVKSIGASAGLSWATSALGLGMGASLVVPMVGGLLLDRAFEAEHAEHEDLLRLQMQVKNKRVGVGQQYINTQEAAKMQGAFYEHDNPYASRFFGDTALGRAFKPDVEKLKVFQSSMDNGLLSFESLDADSIIKQINKISDVVEKFSRIGKVTREVSMKLMGDLKSSGIHGERLTADFAHAAITSSNTGIDLQELVGLKSGVARDASYRGYDTFSASRGVENIISGYAMMQANGMFAQKDKGRLTQLRQQENTGGGTSEFWDLYLRFGGDMNKINEFLAKRGGGSTAQGLANLPMANLPVIDHVTATVDMALNQGAKNWNDIYKKGGFNTHPELLSSGMAYYLGADKDNEDQARQGAYRRITGKDLYTKTLRDFGSDAVYETTNALFGRKSVDYFRSKEMGLNGNARLYGMYSRGDLETISKSIGETYLGEKIKNIKISSNPTIEEAERANQELLGILPINKNGKFDDNIERLLPWSYREGPDKQVDRRIMVRHALETLNPETFSRISNAVSRHEQNATRYGEVLGILDASMNGRQASSRAVKLGEEWASRLQGDNLKLFTELVGTSKFDTTSDTKLANIPIQQIMEKLKAQGVNVSIFESGINTTQANIQDRFYAALSSLNQGEWGKNKDVINLEKSESRRLHMKLQDYQQGYKPVLDFMNKYKVDANGNVASEFLEKDNELNVQGRKDLAALLTSKDANIKKYISGYLSHPERLAKELELGTPLSNILPGQLKSLMSHHEEIDVSLNEAIKKEMEATRDPASAAINKMNDILDKIWVQMGGNDKKSPEQTQTTKPKQ